MVEYSIKKQNLVFPLICALLFVLLGILMVTGVIGPAEDGTEIDRIGGIVIGWLAILFFGWISVHAIVVTCKKGEGPVIVMDENGFYDRRVCSKPIPWQEIRKAYIFRGKTIYAAPIRYISLDVIQADAYQKKGIGMTWLGKVFKKLYDEPGITIQTQLFEQSPEDILSAIEKESNGKVSVN